MNASGCVPTLYLYCPSHGLTPHVKTKHRHDTGFGLFVGSKTGLSDGVLVMGLDDVGDFEIGKDVDGEDVLGVAVVGNSVVGNEEVGILVVGRSVIGVFVVGVFVGDLV